jgi:spoIIIJ-associated protein
MTDASASIEPAAPADDNTLRVALATLENLLARMKVSARVAAAWGEPDEPGGLRPLLLNVEGDDLSVLIGRKGETLAALQYITRLIASKQIGAAVNAVVDVAGYKQRREEQLRRLAQRMADQVVQRGRAMALEPMSASERRIIHLALRDHPSVRTESVGDGERRKVTLIPK